MTELLIFCDECKEPKATDEIKLSSGSSEIRRQVCKGCGKILKEEKSQGGIIG